MTDQTATNVTRHSFITGTGAAAAGAATVALTNATLPMRTTPASHGTRNMTS